MEFTGAISFDGMCTPLLLARTNNNETIVGIVSSFMAIECCIVASVLLSMVKQPHKKLPVMYFGSYHTFAWNYIVWNGKKSRVVVYRGIYWMFWKPNISYISDNYYKREKLIQRCKEGRVFSLQGMITEALTPLGFLTGGMLADV